MKRYAMTVMLKDDPEVIRKYEQHHANPWLEVNEALLKCGVRRMFIYRFGRYLFMFMETVDDFDVERDFARYAEDPVAKKWDELMASFQEPVAGAPEGAKWVKMEEIYALEQ